MNSRYIYIISFSFLIFTITTVLVFILAPFPLSILILSILLVISYVVLRDASERDISINVCLPISRKAIHIILLILLITLGILETANIIIMPFNAIAWILLAGLIFGISFQRILKVNMSSYDSASIAYPIGFALISPIGIALLYIPSIYWGSCIIVISLILFLISSYRERKQIAEKGGMGLAASTPQILLFLNSIFLISIYISLYLVIYTHVGLDIARNYLYAIGLRIPSIGDFYYVPPNSIFSVFQSLTLSFTGYNSLVFHFTSVMFNLFGLFVFYRFASIFLEGYGKIAPALATLFWTIFSGFGWFAYIELLLIHPERSFLSLIGLSNAISYGDITWQRIFFQLSMETSFLLVFASIYIMKQKQLDKKTRFVLTTLLVAPLPLVHFYGIVLLYILLLYLILATQNTNSSVIVDYSFPLLGAATMGLLYNLLLIGRSPNFSFETSAHVFMFVAPIFLILLNGFLGIFKKRRVNLSKSISLENLIQSVVLFSLVSFLGVSILWALGLLSFNFVELGTIGYVPIFVYVPKLGIIIVSSLFSLIYITKEKSKERTIFALFYTFILTVLFSRILSDIQLSLFYDYRINTNSFVYTFFNSLLFSFREERLFAIYVILLSLISAISVIPTIRWLSNEFRNFPLKRTLVFTLIFFTITLGSFSTILGVNYFQNRAQKDSPSKLELEAIDILRDYTYGGATATITSPVTSHTYLDYTGATSLISESDAAWSSKYPELPLCFTRKSLDYQTFLYLNKQRDLSQLVSPDEYYLSHLAFSLPQYYSNNDVIIREFNGSMPVSKSNTAMIIPYESNIDMDINFLVGQDPWLALFFNDSINESNIVHGSLVNSSTSVDDSVYFDGSTSSIRIDSPKNGFNQLFIEFSFTPLDVTKASAIVSMFDWGIENGLSWELVQLDRSLGFKLSSDGVHEKLFLSNEIFNTNQTYKIRALYDGMNVRVYCNNALVIEGTFSEGLFNPNVDIVVGAELKNNKPVSHSNMLLNYIIVQGFVPNPNTSFYYGYDLLTFAGYNYTTVSPNDPMLANFANLIIPFDDSRTISILEKIIAKMNTTNQNLFIINTDGFGPVFNEFGNLTHTSFLANAIESEEYFSELQYLSVQRFNLYPDVEVFAEYLNQTISSPAILHKTYDGTNLTYINYFPLIRDGRASDRKIIKCLETVLKSNIDYYNREVPNPWYDEPSLLFDYVNATGQITCTSNSLVNISMNQIKSCSMIANETSYPLSPSDDIELVGNCTLEVTTSAITSRGGYGFYTRLLVEDARFNIYLDHSSYLIVNGSKVYSSKIQIFFTGLVTAVFRQPIITINGTAQFTNLYSLHPSILKAQGRTTSLTGILYFTLFASDSMSIGLPYVLETSIIVNVQHVTPLISSSSSIALLVIPIGIIIVLIDKRFRC